MTMSEDEDYAELPPITVNSSGRDSSWFAMPCAVELAAQRAREERCERELLRLRAQHAAPAPRPRLAHSDSSGSEGEAALAAAVTALRVRTAARAAPPPLAALLRAAAPRLPTAARPFLLEYARATADVSPARAAARASTMLSRIERRLASAGPWAEGEAAACGAWLCLALAAAERARLGAAAARAAHCALEAGAPPADSLEGALLAGVEAPRARLELADALAAGGGRAAALAGGLARGALAALLGAREAGEEAARWRRLEPGAQYAALQLAARARARGGGAREAALLAALAGAPPARDHTPDALKVLVAATKMQVLFPARK